MVAIFVKRFDGQVPNVAPRLLEPSSATAVVNANLLDGTLRGIHAPQLIREMDKGPTVFQASFKVKRPGSPDAWFDTPHPYTDFLKGPLVNDAFDRYYIAAPGMPPLYNTFDRLSVGQRWLRLGVPRPTIPLSVSIVPNPDRSLLTVTRSYCYTYVSEYGEEGPPSDPVTLSGKPNDTWNVLIPPPAPDPDRRLVIKRLYRTVLGSAGETQFWLSGVLPIEQTTAHNDAGLDVQLTSSGTQLESTSWQPPPDGIEGIIAMPDGFLVGFAGRDLYFSEKFRPHAWPREYALSVEHPIVGLGVFGQTCVVCTQGFPVALSGISPGNISMTKTTVAEPCLSRGSIVSSPEGVYYASHNGLVLCASDGVTNITQRLITKEYWKTRYKPEMLRACRYKTMYLGINDRGQGFILNLGDPRVALSEFNSLMSGQNLINDPWTGEVHLIGRNNVYHWDPEYTAPVSALWRSKEFVLERPTNFGVIDIHIGETLSPGYPVLLGSFENDQPVLVGQDQGPPIEVPAVVQPRDPDNPRPSDLTPSSPMGVPVYTEQVRLAEDKAMRIRIWADRQLVFDVEVEASQTIRLPSGFKSDTWQFEVISRVPVLSIALAETMKELRSV